MTTHPEALRLAAELDDGYPLTGDAISAAAELRRQHARITELESQLAQRFDAADVATAAQAVVDRWDTPLWKDVPATAEYIGRLRAALAAGRATAAQAVVPADQDDSLHLCASDLQHSAIYDNNVEMQACLRAVADRIKVIHDRAARAQADSVTAPAGGAVSAPVFAFRRKGLDDFCTCTEERYAELSAKPNLFETRIFYTTPPAQAADSVLEDAARYRWLAASCRSTSEHWGGRWSIVIEGPAPKSHNSEDDFDAAVDAARKQGEKQ